MERRRREMEEEAALMAELAALEAEEANADPVIIYSRKHYRKGSG